MILKDLSSFVLGDRAEGLFIGRHSSGYAFLQGALARASRLTLPALGLSTYLLSWLVDTVLISRARTRY